ncbi:MAG: chromate transporter, partial [Halanaerobiaceae bacterium]
EFVDKQGWVEKDKFIDIISITQTVPGAVAINLSVFLGYNIAGIAGAFIAAVGVAFPSFLVISSIACFYKSFIQFQLVKSFFQGIRPAVVGLILYAAIDLTSEVKWSVHMEVIFVAVILAGIVFNVNAIILILMAITGSSIYFIFKNNLPQVIQNKITSKIKKTEH